MQEYFSAQTVNMRVSLIAIVLIIVSSYIAPSSCVPTKKDRYDIILSNGLLLLFLYYIYT